MSKVALILPETPEKCTECPACTWHGVGAFCKASHKYINAIDRRPDWCQLRFMPAHQQVDQRDGAYYVGWAQGFNDCLRVLGE